VFRLADHLAFCAREADGIAAFRERQAAAFGAERAAWEAAGEFDVRAEPPPPAPVAAVEVPPGATLVSAPLTASVWRVDVALGDRVEAGERLLTLEAMKMETAVEAPAGGEVVEVLAGVGDQVESGAGLVVIA
jgi:urea carboxylase